MEFLIHFTNFDYFSQEAFSSIDTAIDYGVSKGFEFTVWTGKKNSNPFKNPELYRIVASWGTFSGVNRDFP